MFPSPAAPIFTCSPFARLPNLGSMRGAGGLGVVVVVVVVVASVVEEGKGGTVVGTAPFETMQGFDRVDGIFITLLIFLSE